MATAEIESMPASDEVALVDYLRGRDVACPLCNYNVRGLTSNRCPECGRELELTVGLVEPRIGAWVTCLVAVTAAGGMGLMAIFTILQHGWELLLVAGGVSTALGISYFLATVPMVPALIVFRRRYRRLPQTAQWALAGVATVLTALAFAMLVAAQ